LQEKAKSIRLKESVKELNAEKARTESLLYEMIPKAVADRLREGESQANTYQASMVLAMNKFIRQNRQSDR